MAGTRQQRGQDTATRILDAAERLVQIRGFNGFSYADVAAELEVTKASLHYHFAGNSPSEAARMILSALEGAMLVSRPYGDINRFQATAERLFASLARSSSPALTPSR